MNNVNDSSPLKSEEAVAVPLVEVDESVIEDTFCMIKKRWGQTYVYRYSRLPTLYLFPPYSAIRQASIAFTTHICYDICLFMIVFANLIDLAIPNSLPLLFERITLIFYITETFHGAIARGFIFGSYAYLKNPWMCFDFIITLLSLPDLELSINAVFGIQSLRGIRILNLISKIPGVEIMAQGIILSVLRMYGVVMIFSLFLMSVTLTAKQLFMGIFRRRCVKNLPPDFAALNISYYDFINDEANWDVHEHENYVMCGNSTQAQKCEANFTCRIIDKEDDHTSFDSFSLSLINSFRLLTQDEWEEIYDRVIEATGAESVLFFIPVIFLGSYFLLNLMLVVVTSTFDSVVKAKEVNTPLRNYKYHSCFPFDIERLSLYPLPTSSGELKRVFKERDEILAHQRWLDETWLRIKELITLKLNDNQPVDLEDKNSLGNWMRLRILCKKISDSKYFEYFILLTIISNTVLLASEHANMSEKYTLAMTYCSMVITVIFIVELIIKLIAYGKYFLLNWWNILDLIVIGQSLVGIIFHLVGEYSIFRSLRLLELIKFHSTWPALHRMVTIVLSTVGNVISLLIVMILLMLTFAVIGNKILGQRMKPNVKMQRWSFINFGESLFTIFRIFAGEWYNPLSDCLDTSTAPILCVVTILPIFAIGYLVILNVFTAVLLRAFNATALNLPKPLKKKKTSILEEDNAPFIESRDTSSNFKLFLLRMKKFIRSLKFENVIFVLVLGSCITMIFEDVKMYSIDERRYTVEALNLAFTTLFIIEVGLRWLAIGIKKYFAEWWMRFDFFLVLLSITELFIKYIANIPEKDVHRLKALRALRPVRLIPRWQGLQLVAYSLVISLPSIFPVVLLVLFIWLPFAILGVHFFSGRFFRCVDEYDHRITEYIYNKTDCLEKGYEWVDMFYNFDHIGNSYLSLFQLAMFTGWSELVEMMVDFNVEDFQPVRDNRKEFYAFVVIFVFLGAFFSLNLFVGVAVDTFRNTQKDVEMGKAEILLTDSQKKYYAAMLKLGKRKPVKRTDRPSNKILNIFYTISYSLWFRVLILIVITANTVIIAMDSYNDNLHKTKILHHCDLIFTISYCVELAIKMLGLRRFYFNDFWNIFDFLLISVHLIGDVVVLIKPEIGFKPLSFLYAFRLLRVLHLLRLTDMLIDLRRLLYAMMASIPALINISMLLFIIVFIYSIFGMAFFGHVSFDKEIATKLNFQSCISSFILLFRLTTAQGWEEILQSLSVQPPHCSIEKGNCGNFVIAVIFLLSFIIISNIILVNIFIAVILENYINAIMQENDIMSDDNLGNFYRLWKEFDPKATQFISYDYLSNFLNQLNEGMRIAKPNHIAIAHMNLPLTEEGKIHCLNVLKGILEIKAGNVEDSATFRMLCDRIQKKHNKMFPKLRELKFVETTMQLKQRDHAARIIQAYMRKMRQRKFQNVKSKEISK